VLDMFFLTSVDLKNSTRMHSAHNTANNDTPFVEKDYCGRSMPFGARRIHLLIGAKRHGVVCRDATGK